MVNKEIVLETIKKMYESGIDDSVVRQTLKDIGLDDNQAKEFIAEAKGGKPADSAEVKRPEPKPFAERMAAAEEKVDHGAMHATTHLALEEQAVQNLKILEKINEIEKSLHGLGGKHSSGSSPAVNQRLAEMEKQLSKIKAELNATKTIMEKILETDRRVLNKL